MFRRIVLALALLLGASTAQAQIVLDAQSKQLQILLGGAKTTNNLPWQVSGVLATPTQSPPGAVNPISANGVTNGTTGVTMMLSHTGPYQTIVNNVTVQSADTVASTVTVQLVNASSTSIPLIVVTLQVNDTLQYQAGRGWYVTTTGGAEKTNAIGSFRTRTVVAATGTYTTPTGVSAINIRCVAGGGAGGGGASTASDCAAGGGGAGGGYAEKRITAPAATYSVTIGAAGTAGSAGNNPGGAGGDSFFGSSCAAGVVCAKGGAGGLGMAAGTLGIGATVVAATGGVGDFFTQGFGAQPGICLNGTTLGAGGAGGSSEFGTGGPAVVAQGTGAVATGNGGGGGGGLTLNGGSTTQGGAGTIGLCVVEESY